MGRGPWAGGHGPGQYVSNIVGKNTYKITNVTQKQNLQNMNYGIYRYNKNIDDSFLETSSCFIKFRICFGILGAFCAIISYSEYRIWIHCILLYMGTW